MFAQSPRVPIPPIKNKQPAVDLAGFFKILQEAFQIHLKTYGAPDGINPIFVESFPKERLSQPDTPFEIITYRISSSTMAATRNDGSTPRGLTLREVKKSQDKLDYNVVVYGWWEQVIVTFEIWTKDNATANTLAIWFHNFIFTWAFVLKYFEGRGINNFDFLGRLEDTAPRVDEQELYLRQISYTFKLETLIAFEQRQLTDITLTLDSQGTAPTSLPANSTQ